MPAKAGIQRKETLREAAKNKVLTHFHPQGVRRDCTGLKPQQHPLRGDFKTTGSGLRRNDGFPV